MRPLGRYGTDVCLRHCLFLYPAGATGFFESFPKRRTPGVCGAMSKMFVGGCWYFPEKCWKAGGKRTRCPRQPIVDMDVDCRQPRHDENYSSLFVENSHPETLHRDMCIACSGSSSICFTNFQYPKIVFWLLWCKWHNNDVFHTNNFWNQDILYKNSLICSFYENSYFQSIQIPCFCIFFAKNNSLFTKVCLMHTNS